MYVAAGLGESANQVETIKQTFQSKYLETIISLAYQKDLNALLSDIDNFKSEIFRALGTDHHGFVIDDLAIHHFKELKASTIDNQSLTLQNK